MATLEDIAKLRVTFRLYSFLGKIPSDNIALMLYSSGTTSRPKGVALSHRAILYNANQTTHKEFLYHSDCTGSQFSVLAFRSLAHAFGLVSSILAPFSVGAKLVTMPKFEQNLFLRTINRHKIPWLHGLPFFLKFLSSSSVSKKDLKHVKGILCSAAVLHPDSVTALKEKHSIFIQTGYGMTELGFVTLTPLRDERVDYTGVLLPNIRARIIGIETGLPLPPNTPGKFCVQSRGTMSYYHNRPKETEEVLNPDGWFSTGDLAEYTEDGFIKIIDRLNDMIRVDGHLVSPSELEGILENHPSVGEAAVISVPDATYGEIPRAYIVPKGNSTEKELKHYLTDSVTDSYKELRGGIKFVDALPRTPMGKVRRAVLKVGARKEENIQHGD